MRGADDHQSSCYKVTSLSIARDKAASSVLEAAILWTNILYIALLIFGEFLDIRNGSPKPEWRMQ